MPDESFFHVKIVTGAGAVAATIMAIFLFMPIPDICFCFSSGSTATPVVQNGCPDEGAGCERCKPACAGGQDGEKEKVVAENSGLDGGGDGGSAATTIEDHSIEDRSIDDHSITIETVNIYGGAGKTTREGKDWCLLPPPDEVPADDKGEGDKEGRCVGGDSGTKRLLGEIYFKHDKDEFMEDSKEESEKILTGIADEIKQQTVETILLEAYASFPGDPTYNLDLAGKRLQSVVGRIGAQAEGAVWAFRQVIYGESHIYIYRDTEETSDEGNPKNRVVRIFACSDSCGGTGQEVVLSPNP